MSTLSERYAWGVLRAIPDKERAGLEPEIRALVADAVDAARTSAGSVADPDTVERTALSALGDPELLAARYTNRSLYLIGPANYLEWRRLVSLLLTIVVPIVTLATIAAGFIAQESALRAVLNGIGAGLMAGVQLAFWVTVGFAAVERYGTRPKGPLGLWTVDRLPETPAPVRMSAGEAITSIVGGVVLLAVIAWDPPFVTRLDGVSTSVPVFDPALAGTWGLWFVGVAVAEIAFAVVVYASRRWTWPIAAVNAALDAAFVLPAVWLLLTNRLLSPELQAEMDRIGAGAAVAPSVAVISMVLVGVFGWDAIDGFLRARRGARDTVL